MSILAWNDKKGFFLRYCWSCGRWEKRARWECSKSICPEVMYVGHVCSQLLANVSHMQVTKLMSMGQGSKYPCPHLPRAEQQPFMYNKTIYQVAFPPTYLGSSTSTFPTNFSLLIRIQVRIAVPLFPSSVLWERNLSVGKNLPNSLF